MAPRFFYAQGGDIIDNFDNIEIIEIGNSFDIVDTIVLGEMGKLSKSGEVIVVDQ